MEVSSGNKEFNLYKDIQQRTGGEIYIGIVGPVRTGKSTFIKRFMDLMVLPNMEDENSRARTVDELPQSAQGKTIMTTEPKFIPKDAATIHLDGDTEVKVRLIDCVGYMVDGAAGHMEGDPGSFYDWDCRNHGWFLWRTETGKLYIRRGKNHQRAEKFGQTLCRCAEYRASLQR